MEGSQLRQMSANQEVETPLDEAERRQQETYGLWVELRRVLARVRQNLGKDHPLAIKLAAATSTDPDFLPDLAGMREAWHCDVRVLPEVTWQKVFNGWPSVGAGDVRDNYVPQLADLTAVCGGETNVGRYLIVHEDDNPHTKTLPEFGDPVALVVEYGTPRDEAIRQAKLAIEKLEKFYAEHVRSE